MVLVIASFAAIAGYQLWSAWHDIDRREDDYVDDRHSDAFLTGATVVGNTVAFAWAIGASGGVLGTRSLALWLGLILMWAGFGYRAWARRVLGKWFHPVVTAKAEHQLIREGPYHYVRHPIYLGILVSYFGFGLALGTWPSIAFASIPQLVALLYVIHVEEAVLADRLGERYRDYIADTYRFIPGIW